ncbi:MAG: stage V sporulation protein AB [Blautia sp.]|uniref:stage V sporulation protein AB n=1 Tax=Blautia sp. TaxID=1955243 RepID=UPI002422F336|nr:stage V sporulation protein AB [Blautia sp.]MBS6159884.1 stage V sporulation protein AB [Bacillota bacterium]MEE1444305.1 stage V sporulation protein AB [Blautia sp.]
MWQGQIFVGMVGLCGGAVVATALAAFIIELGIIPRYAGITHTAKHILLYEDCLMLGAVIGNLVSIYKISMPLGRIGLGIVGLGFGMFLGSWIIALGEVVRVFPVMARRIGLKKGTGLVILSIAIGKTIGCFLQFFSQV